MNIDRFLQKMQFSNTASFFDGASAYVDDYGSFLVSK